MKQLIAFFTIIRPVNLLIIGLMQFMLKYLLLSPYVELHGLSLQISTLDFSLWVAGTILIAAAGNIINDYFDIKIDRINKPEKIVIGHIIKRRVAMMLHTVLTGAGLVLALFVAYRTGYWMLGLIHFIWAASLWFYSASYKRQFLIGNIIIALCTALVPLSVVFLEIPAMVSGYQENLLEHADTIEPFKSLMQRLLFWSLGFAGFAFLYTLAREITKDIIDIRGDRAMRCRTVPIVWGIEGAKKFILLIYILAIAGLATLQLLFLPDQISFFYLTIGVNFVAVLTAFFTWRASDAAAFNVPSQLNKLIQVLGISYTAIVYYLLTNAMA